MAHSAAATATPFLEVKPIYAPKEVIARYRADGSIILRSCLSIGETVANIVDYLERNAATCPDQVFLGQRGPDRRWDTISYAEAWSRVRAIAQHLCDLGLTADRPIMILSSASIEHALLMLAGMLVGVPVVPVSPAYSLIPDARQRLDDIATLVEPGLVFVQTAAPFDPVRTMAALAAATWVSADGQAGTANIKDWYAAEPGPEVDKRRAAVTPDTIGKILFTSGSTGMPKGVINSQRMLCNAICSSGVLVEPAVPPVQVDWMPWHHTMGGNTVLHGTLRSAGSLYIDDGRPTPEMFGRTLENLRDVPPTTMQSVPAAYGLLVAALERDDALRIAFFSRLERLMYAGASLPQDIWERMQALSVRTTGRPVPFGSGYGTTETGPGITVTHWPSDGHGEIGLPAADIDVKLVPVEKRFEVRVRGNTVTPGYYKRPDLTAAAFDDEGYYQVGDLVEFVDPTNPAQGLRFAGRLSENFKLANGSWVATGDLRLAVLEACRPLISDLVIAGLDQADVRIMVWPAPGADPDLLQDQLTERLTTYNAHAGGVTHRIAAFRILDEPPSIGNGETTDKGYVNQRGVLSRRAHLVDELYASRPGPGVVSLPVTGAPQ